VEEEKLQKNREAAKASRAKQKEAIAAMTQMCVVNPSFEPRSRARIKATQPAELTCPNRSVLHSRSSRTSPCDDMIPSPALSPNRSDCPGPPRTKP
jgi:hypothetical protein